MTDDNNKVNHATRARKGRNLALALVLFGLAALFYLITLAKFNKDQSGPASRIEQGDRPVE